MAIAPLDYPTEADSSLRSVRSALVSFGETLEQKYLTLGAQESIRALVEIEEISKVIDHLQVVAARAVEVQDTSFARDSAPLLAVAHSDVAGASDGAARVTQYGLSSDPDASGHVTQAAARAAAADEPVRRGGDDPRSEFATCADFLRARLGISRREAHRRLTLAASILPGVAPSGASTPAPMPVLGAASSSGNLSGRAATIIHEAVRRVRCVATPRQLESMEHHLTRQAVEADEDVLRVLARRWEGVLDQDGQEPSEKVLRARQGIFLRGRRNGLHVMEIGATDEQFEQLVTVMNTATNPRGAAATSTQPEQSSSAVPLGASGAVDGFEGAGSPTRPQNLLEGLVSACRIALATERLPATGGHRPQVMVTISYADLVGDLERAGHAVFGQQMSARSIRKLACDADIIPMVLGAQGQVLDIGRAQRLFPAHLRRALVARDRGCAFPDCSIPATWCEAHHIVPWSKGGSTRISDGVLLCSRHHHVMHDSAWTVESRNGIPWFRPPSYVDPGRGLRRNRFWQVEAAVQEQLLYDDRR
ncbi:DUF222 domain-containing protein [Arthrobacter agilis]|uniref:HNH endonuclease signature motif containing protein n=1 Tax=Arthrobacter agilis TaxID=37921 RepID=UPI0023671437|nr:HNH endonuclease signature motif containing protein [Arthrobacter agilis]WDF33988.1 DUF222 domain-containing protein [Arthrobacter agilis]